MSYTRIVVRRGTSTEWSASNPILANGEFGFETNTGKFKIGNGASNWAALEYFANANSVKNDLIAGAPAALNTLDELAAALSDDASFATSITNLINAKAPKASPTFTGTVDFSGATVSGIILPINWMGTYDVGETYAENDMVHYEGSVYYATGPDINGSSYYPTAAGADWELFASKGEDGAPGADGVNGLNGVNGSDGEAATIEVGNSYYPYTGPEGSFVVNTGTSSAAVLDFYLAPGPAGEDGQGMVYAGDYDSATTYNLGDIVKVPISGGSGNPYPLQPLYISLIADNLDNSPVSSPSDWVFFVNDVSENAINAKLSATITDPANGQIIRYNGTSWVNAAPAASGETISSFLLMGA